MLNMILTEKGISFNRLEKEIFKAACEMGCKLLANILEQIDKRISEEREKTKYRHKGRRKTTLKTLMGEVRFSRNVYEQIDEEGRKTYVYLLDQQLGFDTIGLMSTNLAEKIVENATISSYRNTSKNISELTGQNISHGGVWNVVQALGNKLKEEENKQIEAAKSGQMYGEKEVRVLFEEADGVYINIQGKDRTETGKKQEMKVAVTYEGWKESSKNRYELINKRACAGFRTGDGSLFDNTLLIC